VDLMGQLIRVRFVKSNSRNSGRYRSRLTRMKSKVKSRMKNRRFVSYFGSRNHSHRARYRRSHRFGRLL